MKTKHRNQNSHSINRWKRLKKRSTLCHQNIARFHTLQQFHFWIYTPKELKASFPGSIVYISQKVEAIPESINREVGELSVVYPYSELLVNLKKKEHATTWMTVRM